MINNRPCVAGAVLQTVLIGAFGSPEKYGHQKIFYNKSDIHANQKVQMLMQNPIYMQNL